MYRVLRAVNQMRKKWWVKEWVSRKWKNWYQNEVDEKTKGADSRDKVKDMCMLNHCMGECGVVKVEC